MTNTVRDAKVRRFRELSDQPVLVLPNAWDAASAAVLVRAGAAAIATTSGGVAWSLGRPDGEGLSRTEMAGAVRRIVDAVDVPVTADMEGGYGPRRALRQGGRARDRHLRLAGAGPGVPGVERATCLLGGLTYRPPPAS
jgi:2-methylisocitrate lyase-like PEP mutase family enzyme